MGGITRRTQTVVVLGSGVLLARLGGNDDIAISAAREWYSTIVLRRSRYRRAVVVFVGAVLAHALAPAALVGRRGGPEHWAIRGAGSGPVRGEAIQDCGGDTHVFRSTSGSA